MNAPLADKGILPTNVKLMNIEVEVYVFKFQ